MGILESFLKRRTSQSVEKFSNTPAFSDRLEDLNIYSKPHRKLTILLYRSKSCKEKVQKTIEMQTNSSYLCTQIVNDIP